MSAEGHPDMKELLDRLNPAQREAATWKDSPLLILAGAGSGKTRVLTLRIAWLIQECGVAPWEILAVTFTNKAAGEMKERVVDLLGPRGRDVWVSTFHSSCLRILRREIDRLEGYSRDFVIYDDRDSRELVKRILKDGGYPPTVNPQAIRAAIDRAKNEARSPRELMEDPPPGLPPKAGEIYTLYQERLRASNALDFGDLIYVTLRLLEKDPTLLETYRDRFKHILVDEYQDTNHVQYRLVRLLADHGDRNICVVGDEDQSIYSFRGADIRNILDFERDFPGAKVVRLERNYRSSEVILQAASAVVSHNSDRLGKTLWTDRTDGALIELETAYDDGEEARSALDIVRRELARGVQPRDIAIFYRTNGQSRLLEEQLLGARVPFALVGGQRFYDRKDVKDVLAYLKLVVNPGDEMAFRRVVNEPPRGIGSKTVQDLGKEARLAGQTLWDATVAATEGAGKLSGRAKAALAGFRELVEGLRVLARQEPLPALVEAIYERTGMIARLQEEGTFEADGRIEVLEELLGGTAEYAGAEPPSGLMMFLDRVSLVADTDGIPEDDDEGGKVTMMTVHSSKGLEFPVVLVVGMDEKVFPHARSIDFQAELEEERRLAYVAITRAEDRLYLLRARRRPAGRGRAYEPTLPSRFLRDIPPELIRGAADLVGRAAPPAFSRPGPEVPGDAWVDYDTPRSLGSPPSRFAAAAARRQRSLLERREAAARRQHATRVAAESTRFTPPPAPAVAEPRVEFDGAELGADPVAFDEPRVVYDGDIGFEEAEAMIRPGARVRHPDFGEGDVHKVEGSPSNRRVTILFARGGLRRLFLRNTQLEVVS